MKKISWLNQYKIMRQFILDSLNESRIYAKGRMLDVGCGTKPYREVFAGIVEKHIGIDFPSNISANKEQKNVEAYSILPYLPFKNETFDTVLATEVLEHVPEPSFAFNEINRVLKKKGVLILTTPQSWGLHEMPYDYYRYTKYGLSFLAEKNGFEVIHIKPFGGFFSLIGQRLSSYIFYKIALKDDLTPRIILIKAPVHLLCAIVQMIFIKLDRLFETYEDTLGHVIVAIKIKKYQKTDMGDNYK